MNEKIFLHTINNDMSDFYRPKKQKETLEKILSSGKILSRRKLGYPEESFTNFSGMDYISLSDYEKRFEALEAEIADLRAAITELQKEKEDMEFSQLKPAEKEIKDIVTKESKGAMKYFEK